MKALRGLLKFLGYSAFFLVALVFFVYLTLPLGEVEDYLVRKAADEYNADLTFNEEDSLDTCGLTCVEATNVTVQFRASPKEQAEFDAKRKIYLDWRKAQREAVQGQDGAGGSADAPASTAGKKSDADGKDDEKKGDKASAKLDAKDAPKRPENPSKTVELDRLKLAAAPLKLIGGAIDGTLEAELIGGSINAAIVQGEDEIALDATLSDLDASKLDVLRQLIDLPIVGTVGGEVDLKLPLKEDAKGKLGPDLTALTGTLGIALANVAVGPGQIETKSKTGFPFFDVPKTRITQFGGQIVFARKRATFEKFKIAGKDLEGELTGYATLMSKLKDWRLNAHLNLKFSDTFLADHRDVKVAMNSSPYLRKGQSNGYTGFNIHGTVGNVKFRPRKKAATGSRGSKPRTTKRSRAKKAPINRKGRTSTKRPSSRTKAKRSAKRSAARVASPMVRKGRPTAVTDEPEPEDEEPEPEDEEEPETDEPEDDEDGEDGKDDTKEKGDEDEEGDGDEKGEDEEKEE